jgi:glutamate-1-semialdehyde aminotransferase
MRVSQGAMLSLSTPLEIDLANTLKVILPFVDSVKCLTIQFEARGGAVTIARAATARSLVLSEADYTAGVSDWHDVAAVLVEPVITDISDERRSWLEGLRDQCELHGALLIFDETATCFRFPRFCVANFWEIEPDLIILGSALASGLPLAVVAGKRAVMKSSSPYPGSTLSLAAAQKTLALLRGSHYRIDTLWLDAFNALAPSIVRIEGYPTRGVFTGDALGRALFFQESADSGLLFGQTWFFNFPLSEKSDVTISACKDILCKISAGAVKLRKP